VTPSSRAMKLLVLALIAATLAWFIMRPDRLTVVDYETGSWFGKTSEGGPIDFVISEIDGQYFIDAWKVWITLKCEKSSRELRVMLYGTSPIPIAPEGFGLRINNPKVWLTWHGHFLLSRRSARGELRVVWPVLTGSSAEMLAAEKCATPILDWQASPGEPDESVIWADAEPIHIDVPATITR
jgi:hypothetical protein